MGSLGMLLIVFFSAPLWAEDHGIQNTQNAEPRRSIATVQVPVTGAPSRARDLATLDLRGYTDKELEALYKAWLEKLPGLGDPPTTFDILQPYRLGQSEYHDALRGMARIYARLHLTQRRDNDRNSILFPGLLGGILDVLRKANRSRGAGPAEKTWEWELAQAISAAAGDRTLKETLLAGMLASDTWNYTEERLPNIRGADEIAESWNSAYQAMQALSMSESLHELDNGEGLPSRTSAKLRDDTRDLLRLWVNHDYVKFRPKEKDPAFKDRLTWSDNQMVKWGKGYSIILLRRLEEDAKLRELMPPEFRSLSKIKELREAMENSLARNIHGALGDPNSESGVGGSNSHSAMVFANLSALGKAGTYEGKNLIREFLKVVEEKGGGVGALQYAPYRTLTDSETERSSASRAVPFAFAQLMDADTTKNRKDLLQALENYVVYSGTLRAEVPRSGTHGGSDNIAPYYFHPSLPWAAEGVRKLEELGLESRTDRERLQVIHDALEKIVISTWDPGDKSFLNPGSLTYAEGGKTWASALSLYTMAILSRPNAPEPTGPLGRIQFTGDPKLIPESKYEEFDKWYYHYKTHLQDRVSFFDPKITTRSDFEKMQKGICEIIGAQCDPSKVKITISREGTIKIFPKGGRTPYFTYNAGIDAQYTRRFTQR